MRRRRYLALASAALTGGCLRLTGPRDTPTGTDPPDSTGTEPPDGSATSTDTPEGTETPSPVGEVTGTWAQYGFDAANTGAALEASGPTGNVTERWRHAGGEPETVNSSPAVADGRVYFVTDSGGGSDTSRVWAVNATSGDIVWRQSVTGVHDQSPVVADGQVFVASDRGRVFALDADRGTHQWRASVGGTVLLWNRPRASDGTLYVTDKRGSLYALSTADGTMSWERDLGGRCLSGPAVADDRVFVTTFGPTDDSAYPSGTETYHFFGGYLDQEPVASLVETDGSGAVHALSASDGSVEWRADLPDFTVATPAVAGDTVYVGCWDGGLYALSVNDGSRRWRHAVDTPISGSASVADGTVFVGGWDAVLYAIRSDGSRRWILPATGGSKITSKPAVAGGLVYVGVDDGPVTAATTDGRRAWTFEGPVGDFDQSSPAVADGALFVCGDTGRETVDGEQRDVGGLFMLA